MDKLKETFGKREKLSLENARYLCNELERVEETALTSFTATQIAKVMESQLHIIRELTEVLVWMDRTHEEWFDRIMERDVMNTLERLVTNGLMPSAIKMQSLQSVTVLLQNLARTASIYYVCSNNHINRMVAVEFDLHDDEFVSLYVSFLKTLALRCTPDTVQFFFDSTDGAFPLWDRAVRLLSSTDAMVRTAAKQIIVTVAQLQNAEVASFVARAVQDVFSSLLRNVDAQLTKLAAAVPSRTALQRGGSPAPAHPGSRAASPAPLFPSPNTHTVKIQLEDIEDELLYINDLCRTTVPNIGQSAAAAVQRALLPRLQRIVEQEIIDAARAAQQMMAVESDGPVRYARPLYPAFNGPAQSPSEPPATVVLAFLLYWLQVNSAPPLQVALMNFLLRPASSSIHGTGSTAKVSSHSSPTPSPTSLAALVLISARVDLHETVAAILHYTFVQQQQQQQSGSASSTSFTQAPLHFPNSLVQFFYAQTPYQQTGQILVGGPASTSLPPKDKFLQKAWFAVAAGFQSSTPNTTSPLAVTAEVHIPLLLVSLYTQLKFFHVTRLSGFTTTLALLVKLLPRTSDAGSPISCGKLWESVYVEVLKLVHRLLLDGVKQYASLIERMVRVQREADSAVPLGNIALEETHDSMDEDAALTVRDPYAAMFLRLREAVQWLDTAAPDRAALLAAAHTPRDLYLFYPIFPTLQEETCPFILNVWPPSKQLYDQAQQDGGSLLAAYQAAQESAGQTFAASQRSPSTAIEAELNLYLMFLLAEHVFQAREPLGYGRDATLSAALSSSVVCSTLRALAPSRLPQPYFTLSTATAALSVRCELAGVWRAEVHSPPVAPLGTPLCLVLPSTPSPPDGVGGGLLLLEVNDTPMEQIRAQELYNGECKRRVLLRLDLAFVSVAVSPRYPFKVILSHRLSGETMLLHLVMCDASTARLVAMDVEKAANQCRSHGASFCYGIMNYRSALVE